MARPGEFSARGAILDIYPVTYRAPVRLEFQADTLVRLEHSGVYFPVMHTHDENVNEVADGEVQPISFGPDEIEQMAELEHDRWVSERRADGWKLGPERDVLKKITPYLVSWEELPDEVREWDREAVRRIPELLAAVGLEIRRKPQKLVDEE